MRTDLVLLTAALIALLATGCITEPMPDIPQTPEYETVRIEYGESDELEALLNQVNQATIGQSSEFAQFTRQTVLQTNAVLYRHLRTISEVRELPPTRAEAGLWQWEIEQDGAYYFFEITESETEGVEYEFYFGRSATDNARIFWGTMAPAERMAGRQQGTGLVSFDFDALREYDPTTIEGTLHLAFRSFGEVRQVRVGLDEIRGSGEDDRPLAGIFEYTQLPDKTGFFTFFGYNDFGVAGEERFISVDAAWTARRAGRVDAIVAADNGDNQIRVDKCWGEDQRVTYMRTVPHLEETSGGELEDCAEPLQPLELAAPQFGSDPQVMPTVPGPHPGEE